jgi:hypothetical protein
MKVMDPMDEMDEVARPWPGIPREFNACGVGTFKPATKF